MFHGIYKQQIEPQKAKKVIIGIASIAVVATIAFSGINYFSDSDIVKKPEIKKEVKKKDIKKPEPKKEVKKSDTKKPQAKKEVKKTEPKPKLEVKRKNVDEVILRNLNLKTETVLNLLKM